MESPSSADTNQPHSLSGPSRKKYYPLLIFASTLVLGALVFYLAFKISRPKETPAPTAPSPVPAAVEAPCCQLAFDVNPPPNQPPDCVSLAADPTSGEANLEVDFTVTGSDGDGTITKYKIDFGDSQKDEAVTPNFSHVYPAGTYTAVAWVVDDDGEEATAAACSVTLTVTEPPPGNQPPDCIDLTASPTSGDEDLEVDFEVSGSDSDGSVATYRINYGDGDSEESGSNSFTHIYEDGDYTAEAWVVDDDGSQSASTDLCQVAIEVEEEEEETHHECRDERCVEVEGDGIEECDHDADCAEEEEEEEEETYLPPTVPEEAPEVPATGAASVVRDWLVSIGSGLVGLGLLLLLL